MDKPDDFLDFKEIRPGVYRLSKAARKHLKAKALKRSQRPKRTHSGTRRRRFNFYEEVENNGE